MNISIWWIPVAAIGGLLGGGLLGGYFATRGCREKIARLEEERKQETQEMENYRKSIEEKLNKKEKELDEKIEEGMKEIKKPVKSAENMSRRAKDHPVRITEEEFDKDVDTGVDSEELMYYRLDSVLADAHDEIVDDPIDLIGKDAYDMLDIVEDDEMFVRNFELETDFNITIDSKLSYYRDVVGSMSD